MTSSDATPTHPKSWLARTWRRWARALHRDLGYLTVGLTIIYAVSGIYVNHTFELNPSYAVERETRTFEPIPVSDRDTMVAELVKRLGLPGPPKESFRPSPEKVELFYENVSVKAEATAGSAVLETTSPRPLVREMNTLHLNRLRGAWTWVADGYGVILVFLAVSGAVLLKGRDGITGRGKWLIAVGLAVPIAFLLLTSS